MKSVLDFSTRFRVRAVRAPLAGAAIAMLLSACGGASGSGGLLGSGSPAPISTPTPTPTSTVAPTPTPTPTPTPSSTATTVGSGTVDVSPTIASNFDVSSELIPAWGTGALPPSMSPDVVGAFRFVCNPSHEAYDDPIVYPGQKGKSHLHEFFGNTLTDANSTYTSLRTTGESTCNNKLNRSAYWMPALLDGKGSVVRPDFIAVYYKRFPKMSAACAQAAVKGCVNQPNGLRMIFGFDMLTMKPATGALTYACVQPNGTVISAQGATFPTVAAACRAPNQIEARLASPQCWNGKLDSANHRDHVAYMVYGDPAGPKCPAGYDYLIPEFTLGAFYTPDANAGTYAFSSDVAMGMAAGSTFHTDIFTAWDDATEKMWSDNCIDKLLSCTGGDLGNGLQMKNFAAFSWLANPRLVPVPAK